MINFGENLLKLFLILLSSLNFIECRELSMEVNPDCLHNCSAYNLVYIKSTADEDIIHYLWSSITCIPPTLLIVETERNSTLKINWDTLTKDICSKDKDLKKAIGFEGGKVTNSIGFQFTRLFFFNDIHKRGSFEKNDTKLEILWENLIWEKIDPIPKIGDSVKLSLKASNESLPALQNGSLAFDLRVDNSDGREGELPHLAFTQKSVSLQMNVNNVDTKDYFNRYFNQTDSNARLMAEIFVMTGGITSGKQPDFDSITSIDDEYTPGVFRRMVLDLKNGEKESKNSFLSWKPIAYNSGERIIANTMDVIQGKVESLNSSELSQYNSRIFEAFFDENNSSKYRFDLTFGAPDDDTYYTKEKNYNTFSLVVGVDSAPDEELSFLVKIIIVVGFGLPALVMVINALYLVVRKIRKRNMNALLLSQSHQTLDD